MLSVTLIANAGVLIQCGKVRILLDAVEDAGQYPFSSTPEKVLEEMFSQTGERPYRNADFLIFSHGHPDHFSGELAETYLAFNQVRRIVCGPAEDEKARSFLEAAKHKGISVWKLRWERGALRHYQLTKDICMTALCTKHMPDLFPKDLCSSLLFRYQGKNVLFLTDCSYGEEALLKTFGKLPLEAVFLNPYFYYSEHGRQILNQYQARRIILYHIPFAGEDPIHLRALAGQLVKKYPGEGLLLFDEPFQRVTL